MSINNFIKHQHQTRLVHDHMCVCAHLLSHVQVFAAPRTLAHQAPSTMGILQGKNLDKNKISQKSYLNTEKSLNNFHTRKKSSALLPGKTSGSMVKNPSAKQEMWVLSLAQEDPWRRKWQPSPVFLPGKSHGQRSLAGNSPWSPRVRHDLATTPPPPPL